MRHNDIVIHEMIDKYLMTPLNGNLQISDVPVSAVVKVSHWPVVPVVKRSSAPTPREVKIIDGPVTRFNTPKENHV